MAFAAAFLLASTAASAQSSIRNSLSLADSDRKVAARSPAPSSQEADEEEESPFEGGTDDFFNIREANPLLDKGEWELELPVTWETRSNHHRDQVSFEIALSYGLTDDAYVEIELLPVELGDGGHQGNGDVGITFFNRFVRESEKLPAVAAWANLRIPSGQGSSGVDAELHLALTRTLARDLRMHLAGFVETANGGRDSDQRENRRPFQWGIGPGFDYAFDSSNVAVLDFLNCTSDQRGGHNQNVLEIGGYHLFGENHALKLAIDIGLDGQRETPNLGVKLEYALWWGGL